MFITDKQIIEFASVLRIQGHSPATVVKYHREAAAFAAWLGEVYLPGSCASGSGVSAWSENAMLWATHSGIIDSIDGMLTPQGQATRAQVATMLMRFREAI